MKVVTVKNNWLLESDLRLDASFHLSDAVKTKRIIEKFCPYSKVLLKNEASELFKGNIHKRVYVDSIEHGSMFYTASDMFKANLDSGKYLSKKHSPYLKELELKKDWILITRSGTLGNVVYTTTDYEGKIGTDDLVRIKPIENKIKKGYLYAYLSSKYGYGLLTQSSYGGVVKHIEPHHIEDLPIPILPEDKQQVVNNLIIEMNNLRVEANLLLNESIKLFESKLPEIKFEKIYIAGINSRVNYASRLEATYNTNSIESFYRELANRDIQTKTIKELSKDVFTPGIFKRVRTNNIEKGIPFLSGSDLINRYPRISNFLSKKMKNINNYILKEGWIAIQDSGTIGYISIITKFIDGVSATNNLVRIVPNEDSNYNYYIYCFFKTKIGQMLLKTLEYGSVQKHIDNNQISNFKMPLIEGVFDLVSKNLELSTSNLSKACSLEKEAIEFVEKEIESWQK